jgi:hypothetical protein
VQMQNESDNWRLLSLLLLQEFLRLSRLFISQYVQLKIMKNTCYFQKRSRRRRNGANIAHCPCPFCHCLFFKTFRREWMGWEEMSEMCRACKNFLAFRRDLALPFLLCRL